MKAVILAAGEGKRLQNLTEGKPKGLLKLLGLTILERIILAVREAGIKDIIIATGYKGHEIEQHLGDGSRYNIRITYVRNDEWKKGNGTSLLAVKDLIEPDEKFLLLMSDHIFEEKIVKELLAERRDSPISVMCIDRPSRTDDLHEATKVLVDSEGFIIDAGKEITKYNGVDCGIFLMHPDVFHFMEEAILHGENTLNDGVRRLAKERKLCSHPIRDAFWEDIDKETSFERAKKKLLESLKSPRDGFISRMINRRVSIKITKALADYDITPTEISLTSFLVCILSSIFFCLRLSILGGVAAQLASILDGVDGEIARLKFRSSRYGGYLDSILDRYADATILLGMSWLSYRQITHPVVLLVSALALIGSPLSMLGKEKFQALTGKPYLPEKYDGWLRHLPVNRDGRLLIIMLGGIFDLVFIAVCILAFLSNLQAVARLFSVKKAMAIE